MTIISTRARRVKTTRKTTRCRRPVRRRAHRSVGFAVTAPGFAEPSDEDKSAAAAMFSPAADWSALHGRRRQWRSLRSV